MSRQLRADVTGVGEDSAQKARPNPFKRAPAVAVGAALLFSGIANFVFPFASFESRRAVSINEGGPAIMSNAPTIPRPNFPEGVCRVPEDDIKPTMNHQNKGKE